MLYNSGWKRGFMAGLVTGLALYVIAKSPRGKVVVKAMRGVGNIVKDQVNTMSKQASDMIESTVQVAENISRRENMEPGTTYGAGSNYAAVQPGI